MGLEPRLSSTSSTQFSGADGREGFPADALERPAAALSAAAARLGLSWNCP